VFSALAWAAAIERHDLIEVDAKELGKYVICGEHFEEPAFLNDLHNRLQPSAVPSKRLRLSTGEFYVDFTSKILKRSNVLCLNYCRLLFLFFLSLRMSTAVLLQVV
jgi:THAP domain